MKTGVKLFEIWWRDDDDDDAMTIIISTLTIVTINEGKQNGIQNMMMVVEDNPNQCHLNGLKIFSKQMIQRIMYAITTTTIQQNTNNKIHKLNQRAEKLNLEREKL